MLAMDMLHLHAGVPHSCVQDPLGSVTGDELQQLALEAAQEVAVQVGKKMHTWFDMFNLDKILDCRETGGIHSLLPLA
jgi:hypothetical protein